MYIVSGIPSLEEMSVAWHLLCKQKYKIDLFYLIPCFRGTGVSYSVFCLDRKFKVYFVEWENKPVVKEKNQTDEYFLKVATS